MSEVAQSCPSLFNPMDCNLPGSSVNGIFNARVLEWVAISFSRGSSWPRDLTPVFRIVGRCFTIWATREAQLHALHAWCSLKKKKSCKYKYFELIIGKDNPTQKHNNALKWVIIYSRNTRVIKYQESNGIIHYTKELKKQHNHRRGK